MLFREGTSLENSPRLLGLVFLFMPTIARFWMFASGFYFFVYAQHERGVLSRNTLEKEKVVEY
jgi:hypothetical protein